MVGEPTSMGSKDNQIVWAFQMMTLKVWERHGSLGALDDAWPDGKHQSVARGAAKSFIDARFELGAGP